MHSISFDPQRRMVAASFAGDVLISERCEVVDEMAQAAELMEATKVLVDFTRAKLHRTSVEMAVRFARKLSSDEGLRQCQVAYVLPEAYGFEPAIELFARGRGFAAERFTSKDDAIAWLEG
jgi:hypothetical protein